jgi:hypothetical protein
LAFVATVFNKSPAIEGMNEQARHHREETIRKVEEEQKRIK